MDKCPKEKCIYWEIGKDRYGDYARCRLRKYDSNEYGTFLQGYACRLDEGMENKCQLKKDPIANIGDKVWVFKGNYEAKTIDDCIELKEITYFSYWPHNSVRNEDQYVSYYFTDGKSSNDFYGGDGMLDRKNVFLTKEECIKEFEETFKHIQENQRVRKEREKKELKEKLDKLENEN
jgi:hypothetical protein